MHFHDGPLAIQCIFTLRRQGYLHSASGRRHNFVDKKKKIDEENHQKANRWRQPPCATAHCQRSTMKGRKELNAIEQRDTNTAPGQVHAMNSAHGGRRGMSARCSSSMLFCLCPRRLRSRHPERFWVCTRVKPHHSYWPSSCIPSWPACSSCALPVDAQRLMMTLQLTQC